MAQEPGRPDEMKKEDFISKFQINEIVPLLRVSERYNVDISEGKRFLIRALHVARTTRNMDEIVIALETSKREIEKALQAHFTRWHSFLKMDLEAKKTLVPQDSSLPHLLQTAGVFIVDKNYDTAAALLGRCEIELLKVLTGSATPNAQPSQPSTTPDLLVQRQQTSSSPIPSSTQSSTPSPSTTGGAPAGPVAPPIQTQPIQVSPSLIQAAVDASHSTAEPAKFKGYQRIAVEELVKCGVCMGKIKAGAMAIECDCGIYYHEPCAKRIGKCQNCGVEIKD